MKQPKQKDDVLIEDVEYLSFVLESNLAAHDLLVRVVEINIMPKYLELQLETGKGVAIADLESLSKDIALFLASPTGSIELIAPIPGTHRIGINLPRRTDANKQPMPENEPAEILVREKNIPYYLRNFVADVLFLIVEGLIWIESRLYLSETIEKPFVSTADKETPKDES